MTQEVFFEKYKYDVATSKIGSGTFGTVYKAYDLEKHHFVALKIAEVKTLNNKRLSIADEIQKSLLLPSHPNVVGYDKVFTFQQATGTYDLALMPFFQSGNLSELLTKDTISQPDKENIALQILDGLEFLHNRFIIHGNLKPSNILLDIESSAGVSRFTPKIADFCFANISGCLSRSSSDMHALQYSSPEKLKGEILTKKSDLWSWAAISYNILTGKDLFISEHQTGEIQLMKAILEDDISYKLNELPENWRIAIYDALIKVPTERINSATELKNILSEEPVKQSIATSSTDEPSLTSNDEYIEYEVQVEADPIPISKKTFEPTKREPTSVITEDKPKHKVWPWIAVLLILIPVAFYIYKNSGLFGNSLSEKKAKAILTKMMNIRSEKCFDEIADVFTNPTDKYFTENDISRKNIVTDMENFSKNQGIEQVKITDFGRTVENMFHFTMTYNLRDKKSRQITSYRVNGEVGFVKENDLFKINYIINRDVRNQRTTFNYSTVASRKQQDFSDYLLTYYSSLLYLPEVKDDYLLHYIYSDLLSVQPKGYSKELLQKALQDDYIEFINLAEKQMSEIWSDTSVTFSKQVEMTTAFVDANFLSLQIVHNSIFGSPTPIFFVRYKNVDYSQGKVLILDNIVNTDAVPWIEIIRKAFKNRAVTAGGKAIEEENISSLPGEPSNFYFNTKKLFLVYGADEIPEAAFLGPITVSVPLDEIKNYLTRYFREKIENSSKVNIKKV